MSSDVDLFALPPLERELMALCLRLSPGDLQHQRYVWEYLRVKEIWLAVRLILAGLGPLGLDEADRVALVSLIESHDDEMWAAPGSAHAWVLGQLNGRG